MLTIRRDEEIFTASQDWFHARWHFSFSHYRDPEQTGVGPLRVFNDDRIVAGASWPMHPHRDIESLTYVVSGTFEHDDSLGNGGVLEPGGAQVMTFSSRGARHAERNGSDTAPMRFIQFWVLPAVEGLDSAVQQHQYTGADRTDDWLQIMGPAGEDGLDLHQDARALVSRLTDGHGLDREVPAGRGAYLYVIEGETGLGSDKLAAGDAAEVRGPETVQLRAVDDTELILIDVPLEFEPIGVWRGRV